MVKIAARTITLNVFKLNYQPATDYICQDTARPYFLDLVSQLHELKFVVTNTVIDYQNFENQNGFLISSDDKISVNKKDHLSSLIEDHQEVINYCLDIFGVRCRQLSRILEKCLVESLVKPHYVGRALLKTTSSSRRPSSSSSSDTNTSNKSPDLEISLLFLCHILHTLPNLRYKIFCSINISNLINLLILKLSEPILTTTLMVLRFVYGYIFDLSHEEMEYFIILDEDDDDRSDNAWEEVSLPSSEDENFDSENVKSGSIGMGLFICFFFFNEEFSFGSQLLIHVMHTYINLKKIKLETISNQSCQPPDQSGPPTAPSATKPH